MEQPQVVAVEGKFWLRYNGKEVELPKPKDTCEWSVVNVEGTWMVSDTQRRKRVDALLNLARARPLPASCLIQFDCSKWILIV